MIQCLAFAALCFAVLPQQPPEAPREVHAWVSQNVAPSSKIRLNINTRNVAIVHVAMIPVDGLDWLCRNHDVKERPRAIGGPTSNFDLTIAKRGQAVNQFDNYFSRQVNLPPMKPGVYEMIFTGGGQSTWAVVNVTNLCAVTKRSPYRSLVWVTDFKSGLVVPRAKIDYFDNRGQRMEVSTTDSDGISLLPMKPGFRRIIVRTDKDIAGLESFAESPDGHLRCLFQTDRPIYRPGQTVSFKAILRLTKGQIYEPESGATVNAQLRDPRDNPLDQQTLHANGIGSVAGSFRIPQEGMMGPYTIVLHVGGQDAYQTFTVSAYRKPEFKVDVKPVQRRYFSGDDLHFSVDAAFYFGAPVPQASVRWTIRRNSSPYRWGNPEDRWFYGGDGNLYARDNFRSSPFVGEGQVVTDNHGHADVLIHSDPNAPDSTYSLSVAVSDSSRRQVDGSGGVTVYASELRLGLSCLKQAVAIGDLVPVEVRVVDIDGHPSAAKVQIQVITQEWIGKEGIFRPKVLSTKTVAVPTTGQATVNLPALAYGELYFVATTHDRNGRKAQAETTVQVMGMDYKPGKEVEAPSIDLKLDKHSYEPGERVRAFVFTNRPKRPLLLTMTGGDLWQYRVYGSSKGSLTWTIPTARSESPNAFVTVNQWSETGMMAGNAIVPLADRDKLLTVQIQPDKAEYKPGDRASFKVRTVDRRGQGVPSEVAVSVVDEAIYAISEDFTPDPYGFYWGQREDRVSTNQSMPEELSGGAFQRSNSVAPIRQRFEDTAFWNALVETGADGNGQVSFEMPGNLTSWRATGRAVTADTRVGAGHMNVTATRPVTLRLATPRVVAQGDRLVLIGTVDNRTARAMPFTVSLEADGVVIDNDHVQALQVPAKGEKTVRWRLFAKDVPGKGFMTLTARVTADGSGSADDGDALQVTVPVVPRGLSSTHLVGGTVATKTKAYIDLPIDTLPQGSLVKVVVSGGIQAGARNGAANLLHYGRYGTMWSVNALKAACVLHVPADADDVKEAFALLSRTQLYDGWGWWEMAPSEAKITAEVGYALALARNNGYTVFNSTFQAAVGGCQNQYNRTNLWEDRARLAASLMFLGDKYAPTLCDEVVQRGLKISPFGKLRLAEALIKTNPGAAQSLVDEVLGLISEGPATAYVPVGFGVGWTASETETTAALLLDLNLLKEKPALQSKLARRLAIPDRQSYSSAEDIASTALALDLYAKEHPDAKEIGQAEVRLNGSSYQLDHSTVSESAMVEIRDPVLHGGSNTLELTRTGDGEALYTVEVHSYRPQLDESIHGVRVVRRFEAMNDAGVWTEISGHVKPSEPVRCTVVVWGDDLPDALKVTEPIPAGFEYVDSDYTSYSREEVRDGAVVHYLLNAGTPTYFRYYLRAESDGRLIALPAVAEYLRRPATHGNSNAMEVIVSP
ncbi:MAG: MG2 domain-containing protein [Fimbriimonas sp.]|nr:MG2 domain-containing protein [Fimbriimonas sp.]